jgi:hypothetical protein
MKFTALNILSFALPHALAATIGERTIGFSDAANVQSFDDVVDWLNGFRCVSRSPHNRAIGYWTDLSSAWNSREYCHPGC